MAAEMDDSKSRSLALHVSQEDIPFEEECLRSRFSLKAWLRYWAHKAADPRAPFEARAALLERAVGELPGSYKLWRLLLDLHTARLLSPDPADTDPTTGIRRPSSKLPPSSPEWTAANACFERSLVLCHKFPSIWLNYCRFLMVQLPLRITLARRTFDRALAALPTTQHRRVWELYLVFANAAGGETCVRIWRRFLKLEPHQAERFADILLSLEPPRTADTARVLATVVMDPNRFASLASSKTPFQYWMQLCDLICEKPDQVNSDDGVPNTIHAATSNADAATSALTLVDHLVPTAQSVVVPSERLNVELVLRAGIIRFTDQVGKLWTSLAKWWIVHGEFDRAREVYEEAMRKVVTVRDFSMVFDAYAKMEEDIISVMMRQLGHVHDQYADDDAGHENDMDEDHDGEKDNDAASRAKTNKASTQDMDVDDHGGMDKDHGDIAAETSVDEIDLELRVARFENLMERRPLLVSDVLLRQNPHNVDEWLSRVRIFLDAKDFDRALEAYAQGVNTVVANKAHGNLHDLWIEYAKFIEEKMEDIDQARSIFERATQVPFKHVDDLARVWCEWAEFEVRHDNFSGALNVLGRATAPPREFGSGATGTAALAAIRYNDESRPAHQRLFKSIRIWSFYVDLEESIGTPESARAVYDRILDLKIATPQVIINYANFLEEHKYYEESFRVYERGIDLFGYPVAFEIWNIYLTKFMARYGGTKLERARDLFEQSLEKCPEQFAKTLYLFYAQVEEEHGLARHAMRIYDRATRAVPEKERAELFNIYIAKAALSFGLVATRDIYQRAVETLPDVQARTMAVNFADMEIKLGEVDRARAILAYVSQFSDPRLDPDFWQRWQEFEVRYGNEDTFKEMLRIKRSVQARYNTEVGFLSSQILAAKRTNAVESGSGAGGAMAELEMAAVAAGAAEATSAEAASGNTGTRVIGFVRAQQTNDAKRAAPAASIVGPSLVAASANPDEIEIGDDDDEEEEDDGKEQMDNDDPEAKHARPAKSEETILNRRGIQKQAVPAGVFGILAPRAAETAASDAANDQPGSKDHSVNMAAEQKDADGANVGARERFKRKQRDGGGR